MLFDPMRSSVQFATSTSIAYAPLGSEHTVRIRSYSISPQLHVHAGCIVYAPMGSKRRVAHCL